KVFALRKRGESLGRGGIRQRPEIRHVLNRESVLGVDCFSADDEGQCTRGLVVQAAIQCHFVNAIPIVGGADIVADPDCSPSVRQRKHVNVTTFQRIVDVVETVLAGAKPCVEETSVGYYSVTPNLCRPI